ncbi:hypothetical protein MMC09_004691 [Bachmanniomyces sp. S44760]|nr:hypothetical protein [Bachmanniomyces sp. S44760]
MKVATYLAAVASLLSTSQTLPMPGQNRSPSAMTVSPATTIFLNETTEAAKSNNTRIEDLKNSVPGFADPSRLFPIFRLGGKRPLPTDRFTDFTISKRGYRVAAPIGSIELNKTEAEASGLLERMTKTKRTPNPNINPATRPDDPEHTKYPLVNTGFLQSLLDPFYQKLQEHEKNNAEISKDNHSGIVLDTERLNNAAVAATAAVDAVFKNVTTGPLGANNSAAATTTTTTTTTTITTTTTTDNNTLAKRNAWDTIRHLLELVLPSSLFGPKKIHHKEKEVGGFSQGLTDEERVVPDDPWVKIQGRHFAEYAKAVFPSSNQEEEKEGTGGLE